MRKSYSHSITYSFPSWFRAKLHDEALRAEFDGVGWDGVSNGRFIFYDTLWAFRTCKYILKYILKNCHQGFQNLMSSWGWGPKFPKTPKVGDYSIFGFKSSHVQVVILKIILAPFFWKECDGRARSARCDVNLKTLGFARHTKRGRETPDANPILKM